VGERKRPQVDILPRIIAENGIGDVLRPICLWRGLANLIELVSMPSGTKVDDPDRDLYSGLIRLHILHHAVKAPIFGLGMLEELARHGYRISPGTLYPLLTGLQRKGYLRSWEEHAGRSRRRVFRATHKGWQALQLARKKIRELFAEIVGDGDEWN
jgi:DNA-binding PadR family transcriptional regulator